MHAFDGWSLGGNSVHISFHFPHHSFWNHNIPYLCILELTVMDTQKPLLVAAPPPPHPKKFFCSGMSSIPQEIIKDNPVAILEGKRCPGQWGKNLSWWHHDGVVTSQTHLANWRQTLADTLSLNSLSWHPCDQTGLRDRCWECVLFVYRVGGGEGKKEGVDRSG